MKVMKITHLIPLVLLAGCVSRPPVFTAPKIAKMPPPLPMMALAAARVRPMVVTPDGPAPSTNQPPAPQITGTGTIANLATNNCMMIQWSMRPFNYSIDTSTNLLSSWRSLGTSLSTTNDLAPGQVVLHTNIFPSGLAVAFTNGTPAVIFLDYDIAYPMKFYRIREIQP